jgi:hypothetical protein
MRPIIRLATIDQNIPGRHVFYRQGYAIEIAAGQPYPARKAVPNLILPA